MTRRPKSKVVPGAEVEAEAEAEAEEEEGEEEGEEEEINTGVRGEDSLKMSSHIRGNR